MQIIIHNTSRTASKKRILGEIDLSQLKTKNMCLIILSLETMTTECKKLYRRKIGLKNMHIKKMFE